LSKPDRKRGQRLTPRAVAWTGRRGMTKRNLRAICGGSGGLGGEFSRSLGTVPEPAPGTVPEPAPGLSRRTDRQNAPSGLGAVWLLPQTTGVPDAHRTGCPDNSASASSSAPFATSPPPYIYTGSQAAAERVLESIRGFRRDSMRSLWDFHFRETDLAAHTFTVTGEGHDASHRSLGHLYPYGETPGALRRGRQPSEQV